MGNIETQKLEQVNLCFFRLVGVGNKRRKVDKEDIQAPEPADCGPGNHWTKTNPGLVGSNIPEDPQPPHLSPEDVAKLAACTSAYDYYRLFNTPQFLDTVVHESKRYAVQKGKDKSLPIVTKDNLRCFEALLLHSGIKTMFPCKTFTKEKQTSKHSYMKVFIYLLDLEMGIYYAKKMGKKAEWKFREK